ncbi:hypothetical protein [Neobacillus niacini]|uniref:hypothetical protein n=1 Tax=Neobacillus niacini TaxID=86668 RepID=UPI002FFFAB41
MVMLRKKEDDEKYPKATLGRSLLVFIKIFAVLFVLGIAATAIEHTVSYFRKDEPVEVETQHDTNDSSYSVYDEEFELYFDQHLDRFRDTYERSVTELTSRSITFAEGSAYYGELVDLKEEFEDFTPPDDEQLRKIREKYISYLHNSIEAYSDVNTGKTSMVQYHLELAESTLATLLENYKTYKDGKE